MIRRDHILDQIEQFASTLSKILGLTKQGEWQNASVEAAGAFRQLTGTDERDALELSETELLARLIQQGGPTQIVESKVFMLAALFKASGDVLSGQGQKEEGWRSYLKGLHLLLGLADSNRAAERPDFVPSVEVFITVLGDAPLPAQTRTMLMRHYESEGEFAKAEDALFAIAEIEPPSAALLSFGEAFYQRLSGRSAAALSEGNLPRAEARAGLDDFRMKMKIAAKHEG